MKKLLLINVLMLSIVLTTMGQTYTAVSPGSKTVYRSNQKGLKIQAYADEKISGTWFNSTFTCDGGAVSDFNATIKEHKVSLDNGTTKLDEIDYLPTVGSSVTLTRYEGTYDCSYSYIDANKQICTIGTPFNYGLQGTYTITIKDPAITNNSITVVSGSNIVLNNFTSGDSGFTFKIGATTINGAGWAPGAGVYSVNVTKSYANGIWSGTIMVYVVSAPTTATTVSNTGAYCGSQANLTLTASGSTAVVGTVQYNWWTASAGGTKVKSNSSTYTISPSSTITYYVETLVVVNGWTVTQSARKAANVTINPIPTIASSITNGGNYCGGQQIVFVASGGSNVSEYKWWTAASGGTNITLGVSTGSKTGDTYTKTFSDVASATSFNYYVESRSSAGCISTSRKQVTVTIKPVPGQPTNTTTDFLCNSEAGGNITLQATGDANANWQWADATNFSSILGTNQQYIASNVGATKNYYVRQTINGCNGTYTAVPAIVKAEIPVPTANGDNICPGDIPSLSVSGISGTNYNWYNASLGGTKLNASSSLTFSPASPLTTTTSYWFEYTKDGCVLPSRKEVVANAYSYASVPTIPSQSRCGSGVVNLAVQSPIAGYTYKWYTASVGGTLVNTGSTYGPFLNVSTSYYVETLSNNGCSTSTGARVAVTATVNAIPNPPTDVTTQFLCADQIPGNITVVASGIVGASWEWSDTNTFANILSNTSSYTAVNLNTSHDYYVRQTVDGCTSEYSIITANVYPIPDNPTAIDGAVCGQGKPLLGVGDISGSDFRWFANETGGTKLNNTSSMYFEPLNNLTETTSFWFEYTNDNGCNSINRLEVKAIIHPMATEPIINDVHRCSSGTVQLSVSNPQNGYTYDWYEISSGGTILGTGVNFETPVLTISKVYYVETHSNFGCETAPGTRVPVTAFVEPIPSPPGVINVVSCEQGSFELNAAGTPQGGTYKWYDSNMNFLSEGITYQTGTINSNTDFYVKSKSQYGCESSESLLTVTIIGEVPSPTALDKEVCDHGSMNLLATGGSPGDSYYWYDSDISAFEINIGSSYQTNDLSETTSYWVAIRTSQGCESLRTEVKAIVNPLPDLNVGGTVYICVVGDSYDLTQDEGSTPGGLWSGSGVAQGKFYSGVTGAGEFIVDYDYTDPNTGCANSVSRIVSVAQQESVDAGSDFEVCQNTPSEYNLYDQNFIPAGGLWSSPNADLNSNIDNTGVKVSFEGINPGVYELVYTVGGAGCESSSSAYVTVNEMPVDPTVVEGAVCGSGTVELKLLGTNTGQYYNWYENENDAVAFQTGSSFVTPSITESKTYYVSIQNGNTGCEGNRLPITATVYSIPEIDAGSDLQFCNANATRDLTNDASVLNGVWSGPGINGNMWSASGLAQGEHIINYTYTTTDGCSSVDSRIFTLGIYGDVTVTSDSYKVGEPVFFKSSFDPLIIESIEWNFGDNWTSFETEAIHAYYGPGIYDIAYTISLNNGCVGTFIFPQEVTIEGEEIGIVTGVNNSDIDKEISVYPTLVNNELTLHYYSEKKELITVHVVSPNGILMFDLEKQVDKGENEISLNEIADKISGGMHFLLINDKAIKIIKR